MSMVNTRCSNRAQLHESPQYWPHAPPRLVGACGDDGSSQRTAGRQTAAIADPVDPWQRQQPSSVTTKHSCPIFTFPVPGHGGGSSLSAKLEAPLPEVGLGRRA